MPTTIGVGVKTIACMGLYALSVSDFAVDTHLYRFAVRFNWVPTFTYNGFLLAANQSPALVPTPPLLPQPSEPCCDSATEDEDEDNAWFQAVNPVVSAVMNDLITSVVWSKQKMAPALAPAPPLAPPPTLPEQSPPGAAITTRHILQPSGAAHIPRPRGRARTGMSWDTILGQWVPSPAAPTMMMSSPAPTMMMSSFVSIPPPAPPVSAGLIPPVAAVPVSAEKYLGDIEDLGATLPTRFMRIPHVTEVQTHLMKRFEAENIGHASLFELHANLRTLGMRLCHAQNPRCDICPLADTCDHSTRTLGAEAAKAAGIAARVPKGELQQPWMTFDKWGDEQTDAAEAAEAAETGAASGAVVYGQQTEAGGAEPTSGSAAPAAWDGPFSMEES